ncbi:Solute carrier family 2 [Phytophthora citrophthora]|nr:Solute carrier family 2 [Phytophthora citrophthora]
MPSEAQTDPVYSEATTPRGADNVPVFDEAQKAASRQIKPNMIMYTSILVALLQPFQSGWSSSQTNLSQYNDTDECNARPVADDTCLMFPGHSKLEWTFAVNAWIFGGMIGSLICGHFSDLWGRKKLLFVNCIFMIVGAVVEASVSNVWAFSAGRLIAGIASGTATGTLGAYTNELTPPHMRNILGLGLQISVTIGILFPAITFFFANTSSGWRYLAGFPVILAVLFLLLAPSLCVESPAWLLMKNRREEAKQVLARLYGEENVYTALSWLESSSKPDPEQGLLQESAKQDSLFAPKYRLQLAAAILLSCAQQLSGINAVFYYSSSIFKDAGISDPRVGTLIINFINIWPAFFTGVLAQRFGNRKMILCGEAGMFVMAVLMTVAFLVDVPALSIVFTALYVIAFGVTLGPLVWVITADLFPDSVRATATSIGIGANWLCNLIVGVAYPYIADALDDYSYLPFIVLLAIFFLLSLKLVPETSNKSAEEVQREYEERYRSRQ